MPPLRALIPILTACWVPVFVGSLDSTIVATLLTSISSSFKSSEQSAWLGSAFLVSVACFTPIYGRLCDVIGRRYTMLIALGLFTLGTTLCGTATSMNMLIAARAIAGMGAGGVTTTSSVVMSDLVPIKTRGLLQGLTNIIFGIGGGLGGPVGGWLNDTLGWKPAFLIQLPVLAIAFILILIYFENKPRAVRVGGHHANESKWTQLKRIDALGSLTLLIGVSAPLIALSLISANDRPVTDGTVLGGLILGPIFVGLFVFVEARVAVKPIMPLYLLQQRTGLSHALANFFLSFASFASLYNVPLYFQAVRLESASDAGLHLLPYSIALSVSSVTAGAYMRKYGRFYSYTIVSSCLMIVTPVMFCIVVGREDVWPDWAFYPMFLPAGWGGAAVLTTTLIALINSVSRADIAVATSMSYLFRNTGQILGVSLSGLLLQSLLKRQLQQTLGHLPHAAELISQIRHETSVIKTLPSDIRAEAVRAYASALRWVFVLYLAATVAMCAANLILERKVLLGFVESDKKDSNVEIGAQSTSRKAAIGRTE
ncbi:MFS general substrate transporter [Tilletiaria anomala UBC 951]|uniref:MFS general substrate transporter n=1 Tax=Tilletiaria anomala (strain ATCC 24038 / CBS 436.72 / UBC 951) TaxID=1037660 RepID=A0A066VBE7_TILAU|nr:MFS general substrate transporter [Tilletiaria anomala UBC 951]KDN36089.1 MFS general substrate transporter [Tilletiaria anomala UBC 951]